jgi:toxin ParE1/3/4
VIVQLVAACDRLEYLPERGRPGLMPGTRELPALMPIPGLNKRKTSN